MRHTVTDNALLCAFGVDFTHKLLSSIKVFRLFNSWQVTSKHECNPFNTCGSLCNAEAPQPLHSSHCSAIVGITRSYLITEVASRSVFFFFFSCRVMIVNPCQPQCGGFSCLVPVITTLGVLRNVGLSCSPFLPPLSLCLCLTLCPLPSLKQGISLTFFYFFSQGYSSIFHSGAHILSQIQETLGSLRRQGTPIVARYCAH